MPNKKSLMEEITQIVSGIFSKMRKRDELVKLGLSKNEANWFVAQKDKSSAKTKKSVRKSPKHIENSELTAKTKNAGKVTISESESGILLYEHQQKAFSKLQNEIIKTNKNPFAGLLVLPTGGGKTLTAAYWIAENFLDKGKKVLWVAHRHELLEQAKDTFSEKLAYKDIFKNAKSFNYRILSGIHDKPVNVKSTDNLIISSKDSLNAGFNYLQKNWLKKDDEIFLVIDEAHHATAKTYRKLIKNLKDTVSVFRLLGLTATPTRTAENEQGLLAKIFPDNIVYKIDLKTLIRLGILSEPIFEEEKTGINLINEFTEAEIELIANSNNFEIEKIGDKIAKTIAQNNERNLAIVNKYVKNQEKYKQTLVFALNVDNAIALNALFREKGVKSEFVIANVKDAATGVSTQFTKENKEKIERFRSEEIQVLINVNILTEGTDVPNVQSVFIARPTISTILMTQMIGRGLRGLKAGGTKDAYIVSFVDDWHDKIVWINPEKLFIEENVDFNDKDSETVKRLLRLVAINKIEEFAILTNQIIDPEKRAELEKLSFIERIPKGIYQFRYLQKVNNESVEQQGEILVYDNIEQSYKDLLKTIPDFFKNNKLNRKEGLKDDELEKYAQQFENEFFIGTEQYPAYQIEDIKSLLQYYSIQEKLPVFITLEDREKYDIDKIAQEIIAKDLRHSEENAMINEIWASSEIAWQTFFNYDFRYFSREISIAKERITHSKLFERQIIKPLEEYESRKYENMTLYEIREENPQYEKWLRDEVFKKFTDKDGYYFSAESGFRSKNRLIFQIDHIKPISKGGLTVLENLQVLTRAENALKGNKE